MSTFLRAKHPGLESAAVGDDIFATVDSMAALRTRGGTFGQALEETATPRHRAEAEGEGNPPG